MLKNLSFVLVLLPAISAATDHCPAERPFHRGDNACDSCDWRELAEQYRAGKLSTTRESRLFDHQIRVSTFCDMDRPVDIEDVFMKLDAVEEEFSMLFGRSINRSDGLNREGRPLVLEVVVGICDYGDGVDDCSMYMLCSQALDLGGCDPSTGQAYRNSPNEATHIAFVPYLPYGEFWWIWGNRYGNLQHEFTHLLDFSYVRVDDRRGPDTDWWVEGLAQYVQWKQLNDRLSWDRGNDRASMLEVFTHRRNTTDYYDGMRVFAYLSDNAPWLLERAANALRVGVYDSPALHLEWHDWIGYVSWRHQRSWTDWRANRPGLGRAPSWDLMLGTPDPHERRPDSPRVPQVPPLMHEDP